MAKAAQPELIQLARDVKRFRGEASRCAVAPHPDLNERLKDAFAQLRGEADEAIADRVRLGVEPTRLGFNDGVIVPPDDFPVGTPVAVIRSAAADRTPLRGVVRVVVILVEFSDRSMSATADDFRRLFFSTGEISTGSVREYYNEVTNGLITIDGEVLGPYVMPLTLEQYAHGASGIGAALPNASTRAMR